MEKKTALNPRLFVVGALAVLIGLVITYIAITSTAGFYNKVKNSWDEISFAYNHPNLVRAMREEHASRSAQIERELMKHEKEETEQDKLIRELREQLEASK